MRTYRASNYRMNKCIRIIEDYCEQNNCTSFYGKELEQLCSNRKNLLALRSLEAAEEIRTSTMDGSRIPSVIWLENKGILHFYTRYEKRKSSVLGFIAGVASTLICTNFYNICNFFMAVFEAIFR